MQKAEPELQEKSGLRMPGEIALRLCLLRSSCVVSAISKPKRRHPFCSNSRRMAEAAAVAGALITAVAGALISAPTNEMTAASLGRSHISDNQAGERLPACR